MTEVVFEVSDDQYPICRFTRENEDARGVYRVVDSGASSGVFRATLTLLARPEVANALVKELRASRRYDELEVLSITPHAVMLRLGHKLPDARSAVGAGVRPVERILEAFGHDVLLEPFVVQGGRIRIRCLILHPIDTKGALVRLQDLQRSLGWTHFRVVRVAEFKAVQYADVLRRLLTPEEEDLLRLALDLGYYDSPKGCTLDGISKRVGLSVSPVHKKLKSIEQILINAHVDPTTAAPPDARRRSRGMYGLAALRNGPGGPGGSMSEVTVRVRWGSYPPLAFTARRPGARVIVQTLLEDPRTAVSCALVVVAAAERDCRDILEHYEKHPSVQSLEVTSRGSDHVSLKLRSLAPVDGAWRDSANPIAHVVQRFGREAYAKPVVMEGEDLWLKFIVVRSLPNEEIVQRLEEAAKEGGWDEIEIVSLRRVDVDPAVTPLPQPEKMTARQEEVLKIAHALGYYKTPRESTLEDVAQTLGISANAIHKNLTAAEAKLISNYLSAGA